VCSSVLQCVAGGFSMLQCVELPQLKTELVKDCVAVCGSALQCVAVCCSVLQCVAVC